MAFTITSMQRRPDIGFRSVSRHTYEGARELAANLVAEGALEIEVRDDRGNMLSMGELATRSAESPDRERDIIRRLSPA